MELQKEICRPVGPTLAALSALLQLFDKHFGRIHKYHKIYSRNNVKISYSCMDNITNIISSQNKTITNSCNGTNGKTCNCRNKNNRPLDNKCLTDRIVYIYLIDCDIKWSIFKKSTGYSIVSKSWKLCILEKLVICSFRHMQYAIWDKLLFKRLNLVSKCRHENKCFNKYFNKSIILDLINSQTYHNLIIVCICNVIC